MADIDLAYGHRKATTLAGLKSVLQPGEIGLVTADNSIVMKDYTGAYLNLKAGGEIILFTGDDIAAVVAAIGATSATIKIAGVITLAANLTIPSNISINPLKGAMFSGAYTLTINNLGNSPNFQWIGSDVTVVFGTDLVTDVLPQWWGAIGGTGSYLTDQTAAFQKAVDCGKNSSPKKPVHVPPGYYVVENLTIYDSTKLYGTDNSYLMPLDGSNFMVHTGATSQVTNIRIEKIGFYNDNVSIPMKCIKIAPGAPGFANQGVYLNKIRIERNVYQGIDLTGQQFGQCYLSEILMRRLNPVANIAGVAQPRDSSTFGIKCSGLISARDIEIIGSFHKGFWGYNAFVKLDGYNIAGSGSLAGSDDYWIENGVYLDGSSGIVMNGYHEKHYVAGLRPIDEQAIRLVNGTKRVLVDSVDVEEGSLIVEDVCFDVEVRRSYFLKGTILNYSKNQNVRYCSGNNDLLNNANPMYSPFVYSITDVSPVVDVGRSLESATGGLGFYGGAYPFTVSLSADATATEETTSGYYALGDRALKVVTTTASKYMTLTFYGVIPNQPYVFSGLAMAGTSLKIGNINNTSVNGNGVYGSLLDLTTDFVAGQKWRPVVAALVSTTNILDVKISLTGAGTAYLCAGLLSKGKYNYPNLTN